MVSEHLQVTDVVDKLRVLLDLTPDQYNQDRAILVVELTMDRVRTVLDPVPLEARGLVLDVAERAYDPGRRGVESESEQVGPFQRSRKFAAAGVYLTDRDVAELGRIRDTLQGALSGAFTIRPGVRR